jgi:hypothetical protein
VDEPSATAPWVFTVFGERGLADGISNVLLFAPLGVGLSLAGVARRRAIIAGALISSLIELAQVVIPGRDPNIGDVLSNTVGVAGGVLLATTAGQWLLPSPRRSRVLAGAWTAGAALVAWVTVALLQPSYPKSVYYGQWTPDLGNLEWYRGRVLAAQVGALPVPSWRAANSDMLRAALLAGSPIQVRATAGPPVPGLGSLFSIYDDRQREIVLVGPDRDDLVYRYRTRAVALRLDSPDLRARHLLRGIRRGDSLHVMVSFEDGDTCLAANGRSACGLSPGAGSGWSLVYFARHFPAWLVAMLDAAWLAMLAAPIGYWSPGKGARLMLGGALLVAVLGASAYGGSMLLSEAVYVAGGLGLGAWARAAALGRPPLRGARSP